MADSGGRSVVEITPRQPVVDADIAAATDKKIKSTRNLHSCRVLVSLRTAPFEKWCKAFRAVRYITARSNQSGLILTVDAIQSKPCPFASLKGILEG